MQGKIKKMRTNGDGTILMHDTINTNYNILLLV